MFSLTKKQRPKNQHGILMKVSNHVPTTTTNTRLAITNNQQCEMLDMPHLCRAFTQICLTPHAENTGENLLRLTYNIARIRQLVSKGYEGLNFLGRLKRAERLQYRVRAMAST